MADEKINTDTMRFLTFGNADLPVFREVKQKEWIYYGEKNDEQTNINVDMHYAYRVCVVQSKR